MKKIIYLFAFAALFVACEKEEMSTPPLSVEDPLAEVIRIAQEGAAMLDDAQTRSDIARRIDRSSISCKINPATRAGEADDTLYYVVNYADNAGFAIVSADDNASDGARLIAVTESGSYTAGEKTENEGFNMYIDMLSFGPPTTDSLITENPGRFPGDILDSIVTLTDWVQVQPMVSVTWDQCYPYNQFCPMQDENPTQQSVVGCTAVAIGQIFAKHCHPASFSCTFDDNEENAYTTCTMDWVGINAYDWYYPYFSIYIEPVALFLREIGERCGMVYDNESTSDIYNIASILPSFGYQQPTIQNFHYVTVVSELTANRPVYMRGEYYDYNKNKYVGHAWVVDGYKSRDRDVAYYTYLDDGSYVLWETKHEDFDYLHINWGYSGQCNGYFQKNVYNLGMAYEYDDGSYWPNYTEYTDNFLILTNITPNN